MGSTQNSRRVIVVHRGARDGYQVAAALAGAGLLERLVTDLYWPRDRPWASLLHPSVQRVFARRNHPGLPSSLVHQTPVSGITSFVLEKIKALPFELRRKAIRSTDATLGRVAGKLAAETNSWLLSYSYYGYDAFRSYGQPGSLFQLHPHPLSVRRILERELADHPDCAVSLRKEWELSLPREDFDRLIVETRIAKQFLVASSFTRRTLIENGALPQSIQVIPYGVDLRRFTPPETPREISGPLRLLFVGTITQRKGIKSLLDALHLLGGAPVELTVCGRVIDDLAIFKPFEKQVRLRPSVGFEELPPVYRAADLFVFPSLAEGFGHVLLEALASGLPVLSTTHTAAPDLIEEGREGFVIEPRRPDLIASRIEWAIQNRRQLREMQLAARSRAEQFTWQRFRQGVVEAVRGFLYCYGQTQ
jgi:glycosyltransferase involved in cell wall biosynthesis